MMTKEEKRERSRISRKEREDYLRRIGRCLKCGVNPAAPGRVRCLDCLSVMSLKKAERRARFVRAGLCSRCGRNPPRPGRRMCAECAEDFRVAAAARAARNIGAMRCVACGRASIAGTEYKRCLPCRLRIAQRCREYYRDRKEAQNVPAKEEADVPRGIR